MRTHSHLSSLLESYRKNIPNPKHSGHNHFCRILSTDTPSPVDSHNMYYRRTLDNLCFLVQYCWQMQLRPCLKP